MDKLKEKIAYLKLWLTFLVTIDASVSAWLFNNAGKVNPVKFNICFIMISLVTGLIFFIHRKTYKTIKNMD